MDRRRKNTINSVGIFAIASTLTLSMACVEGEGFEEVSLETAQSALECKEVCKSKAIRVYNSCVEHKSDKGECVEIARSIMDNCVTESCIAPPAAPSCRDECVEIATKKRRLCVKNRGDDPFCIEIARRALNYCLELQCDEETQVEVDERRFDGVVVQPRQPNDEEAPVVEEEQEEDCEGGTCIEGDEIRCEDPDGCVPAQDTCVTECREKGADIFLRCMDALQNVDVCREKGMDFYENCTSFCNG